MTEKTLLCEHKSVYLTEESEFDLKALWKEGTGVHEFTSSLKTLYENVCLQLQGESSGVGNQL